METLQEYLDKIPNEDHQERLDEVIQWVLTSFPEVELQIKWNQPMITHHATFILGFSASSKHFSIAPEPQILNEFRDELTEAGYSHSKSLFRVLWTQSVKYPLLESMIERSIDFKRGSTTFWAK